MPLISIVEEDDFNSTEVSEESEEESEDEAGVSLSFLMEAAEPVISNDQLNQVFEEEESSHGSITLVGHPDAWIYRKLEPRRIDYVSRYIGCGRTLG